MVPGIITEAAETFVGLYHHGSVRWTAHGPRFIFPPVNSFFPTAYACPKCGKIEFYIQLFDETEPREEKITKWIEYTDLLGYCLNCKTNYDFFKNCYLCPICKKRILKKETSKLDKAAHIGDGQPFGVAVTVLHVEQDLATVQDVEGRTYRTPSLMAVGEDVDALLLAEEKRAIQAYEEARRAMYRARAQRRGRA